MAAQNETEDYWMRRHIVYSAGFMVAGFFLSGCLTRTYTVVKDRVDQDVAGNQGFVSGGAPADYQQAPKKFTTRKTRVVEVEFGKPLEIEKAASEPKTGAVPEQIGSRQARPLEVTDSPLEFEPALSEPAQSKELPETYVVRKNDTLQKIAQHFYGTTKKWIKIFEANKEKLKTPDRIRPGQVIKIPKE